MGVALSALRIVMSEQLASDVEAFSAKYGVAGVCVP